MCQPQRRHCQRPPRRRYPHSSVLGCPSPSRAHGDGTHTAGACAPADCPGVLVPSDYTQAQSQKMFAMAEPRLAAMTAAIPASGTRVGGRVAGGACTDDFRMSGPLREHSLVQRCKLQTCPPGRMRTHTVRSSRPAVTVRVELPPNPQPSRSAEQSGVGGDNHVPHLRHGCPEF